MSHLDQVFIKAYGKGALAGHAERPVAPIPATPAPLHRSTPGAPKPIAAKPGTTAHVSLSDWAAAVSGVPAPHIRFGRTPAAVEPAAVVAPTIIAPSPMATDIKSPAPEVKSVVDTRFRAAFEVPRWNWPPLVGLMTTATAAGFASLATVLTQRAQTGRKVIVVSSTRRGEGRSLFTLAAARMLGNRTGRVAVVDADFTHPRLGEMLELDVPYGWEDVLAGDQPLCEALVESIADGVTLLPLRGPIPEPLVDAPTLVAETIGTLSQAFDCVLLDVGPLGDEPAALDFAANFHHARLDDAIVLRDVHRSTAEEVKLVGRRLAAAGIGHWDIVENDAG